MPQGSTTSPFTVYDLNVGTIIDIEDIITQLDPSDVPLLGMNGADGTFAIPRGTAFEKQKDWLDDTLLAPRCNLNSAMLSGDTTTTLAAGDANRFPVGSVLLIDAEYLYVTAVDTTGTILTFTSGRGYGGTTAAGHSAGVPVVGVGMALNEGSQPGVARAVDRVDRQNITQIFGPHLVSVSGTEMVVRKYGLSGTTEFAYQAGQRAKENYIALEQAVYYGIKQDTPSQAAKGRTMGGLTFFITTNVDSSTVTSITEAALLNQHQNAWQAGGNPRNLLMAPKQKRAMSNFQSTADNTTGGGTNAIIRRMAGDNERGEVVDRYISDFGILEAKMSRWLRTQDLFGYDRDQLSLDTLRPMQFELLAKLGDSVQGELVGEYTLVVRRQKHAFRFSALT